MITEMVNDGKRSPGTLDTYRRQLANHVLPTLGEIRLVEATTPLIDRVIAKIKRDVSPSTAKSCRSVISGVTGLAVRYGAVTSNPVRDVERIEIGAKRAPRALKEAERVVWLRQLWNDEKAIRKDLPDLTFFMLATGVGRGEALAAIWSDVGFDAGAWPSTTRWSRSRGRGYCGRGRRAARVSELSSCP